MKLIFGVTADRIFFNATSRVQSHQLYIHNRQLGFNHSQTSWVT